jgi:hypothetical protein
MTHKLKALSIDEYVDVLSESQPTSTLDLGGCLVHTMEHASLGSILLFSTSDGKQAIAHQ